MIQKTQTMIQGPTVSFRGTKCRKGWRLLAKLQSTTLVLSHFSTSPPQVRMTCVEGKYLFLLNSEKS